MPEQDAKVADLLAAPKPVQSAANRRSPGSPGLQVDRQAAAKSAIRWLDVERLMSEPPPPVPWIAEPLLARGHVTILAGPAGVGKSLLALALASAIAHDAPSLAGLPITGGPIVLLDAENGERTLAERAHLVELPPARVRIGLPERFDLRQPDGLGELVAAIEDTEAVLLLLDSLATLAPGIKENDAHEIGPALDRLRRLAQRANVAVLLLHHARKEGDTYRGGTGLPAGVDVLAIYCREHRDRDRERRLLTFDPDRGAKMRIAAEPDPQWLRMNVTAGRLTIDTADPPDELATTPSPPTKRDQLREQLVAIIAESGPINQTDALRAAGLDPTDRTGRRALDDAVEHGEVKRQADLHYITGRQPANPASQEPALADWQAGTPYRGVPCPANPAPTDAARNGSRAATPAEEARAAALIARHEKAEQ